MRSRFRGDHEGTGRKRKKNGGRDARTILRGSTKWSLTLMIGIMTLGLLTELLRGAHIPALSSPVVSTTALIIGSTGAISMLLPYTAECYPLRIRGRASEWIAGCRKLGGMLDQVDVKGGPGERRATPEQPPRHQARTRVVQRQSSFPLAGPPALAASVVPNPP